VHEHRRVSQQLFFSSSSVPKKQTYFISKDVSFFKNKHILLPKMWELRISKVPKKQEKCQNSTSNPISGRLKTKNVFYSQLVVLHATEVN